MATKASALFFFFSHFTLTRFALVSFVFSVCRMLQVRSYKPNSKGELMLELLVLITGIVALYRFSRATRAVAEGVETKTQVWAEDVIKDAVLDRAESYKDWKARSTGLDVISHDRYMIELRGN